MDIIALYAIPPITWSFWLKALLSIIFGCCLAPIVLASWNNPYPASEANANTLYSVFTERPKYLDPARAYSSTEYVFLGQIYEPPLQYHYLFRPYQLEEQTLEKMPEVIFYNEQGQALSVQDVNSQNLEVAYTEYHLTFKKGILYQPHPAFAKNENGEYYYHNLSESQGSQYHTIADFEHTGTRELTAHDYANQIKRIANPSVHSPISGLMQGYIVGLKTLNQQLKEHNEQHSLSYNDYLDLRQFDVDGVKVVNDYELIIRINGRYPQFKYWLAMPFFAPIPWEADRFYTQPGFEKNNISLHWYPVGTGAYMLTENNPNLRMVLEKNPHFREQTYPTEGEPGDKENGLLDDAGKTIPFIDKVVFMREKESIPAWNKFLQGYFDASSISSDSFDSAVNYSASGNIGLTDSMIEKNIELNTAVDTSIFYLGFNMLDSIVGGDSERARLLRQAISIVIDYEEYISIFQNGRGVAAQGPIPPGLFGYKEGEAGINPYVYNWENGRPKRKAVYEAKALLEKAGYKDGIDPKTGKPLILYFESVDSGPDSKARLNWLRKQFKKLNIDLVIRPSDYNRFQEKMKKGVAQIFFWGWNADYPDPENFLFLFHSQQGKVDHLGENAANYANPEFDQLFDQMKNMPNSPERLAIIDQMVEILRRDAPWVFSLHTKTFVLKHSWLKNYKPFLMTNTGTIKYRRIDTDLRQNLREQWNQPIVWPLIITVILIVLLIAPAVLAYRKHQRSRAL